MSHTDIQPMLDFFYRSARDMALINSIDFNVWPTEDAYRELLNNAIQNPFSMPAVAIEFKGKTVGVHLLNNVHPTQADFQAYIWNAQDRGRGILRISWFKASQYFFANSGLETLFFRVPKDNAMSTSAAKKLPLNLVGEEDIPYQGIKPGTRARIYSLSREEFENMSPSGTPLEAEVDDDIEDEDEETDL